MAAPVLILQEIDSTNAEARRRAEAGEFGPLWIAAQRQTEGRGRRGRVWEMPTGNLAQTLLLTLDRSPLDASQLTFVSALAVYDLVAHYVPPSLVSIKWPNDVLLDGRKVSGVLLESGSLGAGGLWVAIGIGVNLKAAPVSTERPATAIAEHLAADHLSPPDFETGAKHLAERFDHWLSVWQTQGFGPVRQAWIERTPGLYGPCTARLTHETLHGTADGVEADGSLRLKLADGSIRIISAGDVFFGDNG